MDLMKFYWFSDSFVFLFDINEAKAGLYPRVCVSHHHVVVGHSHKVVGLGKETCPFPSERISDLLWAIVTLKP